MKLQSEVEDMSDEASEEVADPKLFGMSYEEGVRDALEWVLENNTDSLF